MSAKYNPCAGAVGPASVLLQAFKTLNKSFFSHLPIPIKLRLPTKFKVMV